MGFKIIIALVSIFFIIVLLFFYFIPLKTITFASNSSNGNFSSIPEMDGGMQFYKNMRFPESRISYRILNCPLSKQNSMQLAFELMEDDTSLNFYPVDNNEEISISCEEREKHNGHLFIAGEGGPTNITAIGNFAVILNGEILLIRESNCEKPNVAIHELLHVLGFQHSTNQQNIMYNITNCEQTIGDDVIQLIDELYSIPSYSDLAFENVSAILNGRFLDLDFSVMNLGLKNAEEFKIKIYADKEFIKEIGMEPIDIGYGRFVGMKNIWIPQLNIQDLELVIDSEFEEINKENNKIRLEIKNN